MNEGRTCLALISRYSVQPERITLPSLALVELPTTKVAMRVDFGSKRVAEMVVGRVCVSHSIDFADSLRFGVIEATKLILDRP